MTKKNLQAEVTIRVLGRDLTKAEAEELYEALGKALSKPAAPVIQYIYRDRYPTYPYTAPPLQPWFTTCYNSNALIGGRTADPYPYRLDCAEKLIN